MASSADMHNQLATQYAPADDLPCADFALLVPLKKSPDYRTIRPRIANPKAVDSWQEEGLHFFVFELKPADGAAVDPADLPVAVFTMHPEEPAPISVVVVTPRSDGAEAEVVDLRQPESAYTAPYVTDGHALQQQNGDAPRQHAHDAQVGTPGDGPSQSSIGERAGMAVNSPGAELVLAAAPLRDEPSADQERGRDDRLVADSALLVPLKQSAEYRMIDGRVANPEPVDAWQEDGLHFFTFALQVDTIGKDQAEQPLAVFAMQPDALTPVSAVIVAPGMNGEAAEITNLRALGTGV